MTNVSLGPKHILAGSIVGIITGTLGMLFLQHLLFQISSSGTIDNVALIATIVSSFVGSIIASFIEFFAV